MYNKSTTDAHDIEYYFPGTTVEVGHGTRLLLSEGMRRGYTFTLVDNSKAVIRAEKAGVGFTFRSLPGIASIRDRIEHEYPGTVHQNWLNKKAVLTMLDDSGLPVPQQMATYNPGEVPALQPDTMDFPLVVKPQLGWQSRDVFMNITNWSTVTDLATSVFIDTPMLIEQFITGNDYRILCINGTVVGVVRRYAANVTGDGKHTIEELVAIRNTEPERGAVGDHRYVIHPIVVNDVTLELLKESQLTLKSVPAAGETIQLQRLISASLGADYEDVQTNVHQSIIDVCEKFANEHDMFVIGFDLICSDITQDISQSGGVFNEFNEYPALGLIEKNNIGNQHQVAQFVWDALEVRKSELMTADFPMF